LTAKGWQRRNLTHDNRSGKSQIRNKRLPVKISLKTKNPRTGLFWGFYGKDC